MIEKTTEPLPNLTRWNELLEDICLNTKSFSISNHVQAKCHYIKNQAQSYADLPDEDKENHLIEMMQCISKLIKCMEEAPTNASTFMYASELKKETILLLLRREKREQAFLQNIIKGVY